MKSKSKYFILICFIVGLCATSCNDKLEIKTDYDFTVEHLPVPKRIKKGETVEIRFELLRTGEYDGAKYYIRYFQPDGKGRLRLDGTTLYPNDSYEIKKETFKMFYTSESEEQHNIDLYFFDNFKNRVDLSFSFANEKDDDDVKTE